jgi:hypothetical protein
VGERYFVAGQPEQHVSEDPTTSLRTGNEETGLFDRFGKYRVWEKPQTVAVLVTQRHHRIERFRAVWHHWLDPHRRVVHPDSMSQTG